MGNEFIGQGWAFPVRTDATGGIALVAHERELEESVRLILGTAPGERPMRPQFGCGIHDLVFAPADATTAGRIAYEVRTSLERWEPRINVVSVEASFDEDRQGNVNVSIVYAERETNNRRNLVFPFYVIPDEGAA